MSNITFGYQGLLNGLGFDVGALSFAGLSDGVVVSYQGQLYTMPSAAVTDPLEYNFTTPDYQGHLRLNYGTGLGLGQGGESHSLVNTGVLSISPTTNMVTPVDYHTGLPASAGMLKLNLPQEIATSSSVEFKSMKLSDPTTSRLAYFATDHTLTHASVNTTGLSFTTGELKNTGVTELKGTTDQVSVTASTGSVTLSLPQDIALSSLPTFGGLYIDTGSPPLVNSQRVTYLIDSGIGTKKRLREAYIGYGLEFTHSTISNSGLITNTGVVSLEGTSHQVTVSATHGDVKINLPQDIDTTSSPTFSGLTVNAAASGMLKRVSGVLTTATGNTDYQEPISVTNETNIQLSLGSNLITPGWSGQLSAIRGGTGWGTYVVGDVLYADSTSTLARRAAVAAGYVFMSNGVGVAPVWSSGKALTAVSSTYVNVLVSGASNALLQAASVSANLNTLNWDIGGTGLTSYGVGDLLSYNGDLASLHRISPVATGSILYSQGTSSLPIWSSNPTIGGGLRIGSTTTPVNALDVNGSATISSKLTVGSSTLGTHTLDVNGSSTVLTSMTIGSSTLGANALDVAGSGTVSTKLTVGSSTLGSHALDVNGSGTISTSMTIGSSTLGANALDVTGIATISSKLRVGMTTTTSPFILEATGDAYISGTLASNSRDLTPYKATASRTLTYGGGTTSITIDQYCIGIMKWLVIANTSITTSSISNMSFTLSDSRYYPLAAVSAPIMVCNVGYDCSGNITIGTNGAVTFGPMVLTLSTILVPGSFGIGSQCGTPQWSNTATITVCYI